MRYNTNYRPLTVKELEMMKKLWTRKEMTAREIMELYPEPRPHINTVSTYLKVLEDKGWVKHRPIGTTNLYRAALTEREMGHKSLKTVVSQFFKGSMAGLISELVTKEDLSNKELQELKDIIDKKASER